MRISDWSSDVCSSDLLVVGADPVQMRVVIRKDSPLQHAVRRKTNAGYDAGWRERRLFEFREVVFQVAVQVQNTDLDQRIDLVRPVLGADEGSKTGGASSRVRMLKEVKREGVRGK